jgi:transcriptional regulator with XRE-family HTH domain
MPKSRHTARYERLLQLLRAARKDAGLTQTEVAKHFQSHASFVSKVESGERRLDIVELADFCRLYGMRVATFLKKVGIDWTSRIAPPNSSDFAFGNREVRRESTFASSAFAAADLIVR